MEGNWGELREEEIRGETTGEASRLSRVWYLGLGRGDTGGWEFFPACLGDTGGGRFFLVVMIGSSYSTDPCFMTVRSTVADRFLAFSSV